MHNMTGRFTVSQAQNELLEVALEVRRARWLYVTVARDLPRLPADLRPDFNFGAWAGCFEPIRLFFSWSDYLGALYSGNGKRENRVRIVAWLEFMWGDRQTAEAICDGYRNPLIHARAPGRHSISFGEPAEHLKEVRSGVIRLEVPCLLDETIEAIERYASGIPSTPSGCGSLDAFNAAMDQLRPAPAMAGGQGGAPPP